MAGDLRIDHVRTAGIFSLDGEDFEVENNIWLVGDDDQVLVIDAAHDAGPIVEAVGDRRVVLIACTHGHNDHINAALDLHGFTGAPVALHPEDTMLWNQVYVARGADRKLSGGDALEVAGAKLDVLHTPGHSPGGVCLHVPDLGVVFSGDTLFQGGPGATGRSFSDFPPWWTRSVPGFSRCRPTPPCTPGTGRPPPSATRLPISRSGLTGGTDRSVP